MIMKRLIYAAVVALSCLCGCEYNPYYDGQKMCITYDYFFDPIDSDGEHIYLTLENEYPPQIHIYGGKGKNHRIEVSDPSVMSYTYTESSVERAAFDYAYINEALITLIPLRKGETSMTITDEDTGESIMVHIHFCDTWNALEVKGGESVFSKGTVFAFAYGGRDDVVKICRGNVEKKDITHVADGRYRFVSINDCLCFEITYPADEDGLPSSSGEDVFRRYLVQNYGGGNWGDAVYMLRNIGLGNLRLETREIYEPIMPDQDEYYYAFQFTDVTDLDQSEIVPDEPGYSDSDESEVEVPDLPESERDEFYIAASSIIPYNFD